MDYAGPVVFALLLWWFSTGTIAWLDGRARSSFRWSLTVATVLFAASLWGLEATASDTGVTGAYLAFTCGLMAWAWQEMTFLFGVITGPRRHGCPHNCGGWRHFGHGVQVVLHHELAILATAGVIVGLTWGEPNQTGTWTFVALWLLRISAKLNLFFGVPNLGLEFLPEHLRYLRSYLRREPMNMLFPFSITGCTVALFWLSNIATDSSLPAGLATAYTLLAALVGLALLEHWLMVLPLPSPALWAWFLGDRIHIKAGGVEDGAKSRPNPIEPLAGGRSP